MIVNTVSEKAVLLAVSFHQVGRERKIGDEGQRIKRVKRLFDCDEMLRIARIFRDLRRRLRFYAVPGGTIRDGVYVVKVSAVPKLEDIFAEAEARLAEAIASMQENYTTILAAEQAALGSYFDPEDYPTREELALVFAIERRWFSFDVPDELQAIPDVFERERERARKQWEEILAKAEDTLLAEFRAFIVGLRERLQGDKRLRQAFLDNFREWLEAFEDRTLMPVPELRPLIQRTAQLLPSAVPDRGFRARLARELSTLEAQIPLPKRRIVIDAEFVEEGV